MKKITTLIGLFLGLTVFADHTGQVGSVGYLAGETDELSREVQYSMLNYNVKSAVNRFAYDVDRLYQCVEYSNGRDHTDPSHPGCPNHCGSYLNYARYSFQDVERYLYDTQWDFPRVYNAYRSVKYAMSSISNNGPHPGMQNYKCTATDTGWEEHYGGHVAFGRNYSEAQYSALNECRRYHGSCKIYRCDPA